MRICEITVDRADEKIKRIVAGMNPLGCIICELVVRQKKLSE